MIDYTYKDFRGSKTSRRHKVKAMDHLLILMKEFTILAAVSMRSQIGVFLRCKAEKTIF